MLLKCHVPMQLHYSLERHFFFLPAFRLISKQKRHSAPPGEFVITQANIYCLFLFSLLGKKKKIEVFLCKFPQKD